MSGWFEVYISGNPDPLFVVPNEDGDLIAPIHDILAADNHCSSDGQRDFNIESIRVAPSCRGCRDKLSNQQAHMESGGCLHTPSQSNSNPDNRDEMEDSGEFSSIQIDSLESESYSSVEYDPDMDDGQFEMRRRDVRRRHVNNVAHAYDRVSNFNKSRIDKARRNKKRASMRRARLRQIVGNVLYLIQLC
jgi:hypothetical protein